MRQNQSGSKLVLAILMFASASFASAAVWAQESGTKTTTKTKITIKDGKDIKAVGCVTRAETGALTLTRVADKDGALNDYLLVLDEDKEKDLEQHIGHEVQVSGKAADQGDGKVKFEVEEKRDPKGGDERKTEHSAEMAGNLKLPLLGVKSFKMLAATCR